MYLCLCPQIEPEKMTSVLEKSFRAFNYKHGKAELSKQEGQESPCWVCLPHSKRGLATGGRGISGEALQITPGTMAVICRTNWQERLSFYKSDYKGDNQGPAPTSPSPPPTITTSYSLAFTQ